MPLYETVVIARSEITQAQADAVADAVTAQLETDGGAVKKREYWGLRSLAYRIKKNRKGHYILLGLEAPSPAVVEMERQLKLNEDVLRFMTIRIDEISEEPSVILSRKSDDRERGFRASAAMMSAKSSAPAMNSAPIAKNMAWRRKSDV
jgi:small subunit ribosomal protein S6